MSGNHSLKRRRVDKLSAYFATPCKEGAKAYPRSEFRSRSTALDRRSLKKAKK